MKSATKWGLGAITLLVIALFFLGVNHRTAPEIEEIIRVDSPTNKLVAKVEMAIYGDHWFVNDARYEVRVLQADGKEQEVLVYSVTASGPSDLVVKWIRGDELEIQDSASAMHDAIRKPHPFVRINYRSR